MSNELHIGGDSYGPNAVGRGARARQENVTIGRTGGDRLSVALGTLRDLIDEHRHDIPEVARLEKDLDAVEQDVRDPDPDPERLRDSLKRIAARAVMVPPVLSAVNDLRDIVEHLLT